MNKDIFCGARFAATLRRDWKMQRNGWGARFLAMLGLMFVAELAVVWLCHITTYSIGHNESIAAMEIRHQSHGLSLLFFMFLSFFTTLGASCFYLGYATPGERLNQLMSPASTLEKYLSRFLISIVGVVVAVFLCWEISDMLRIWFTNIFYADRSAPHVSVCDAYAYMASRTPGYMFLTMAIVGWQAVYACGSTFFPKHPFLKTLGVMCIMEFVIGLVTGYTMASLFENKELSPEIINMEVSPDEVGSSFGLIMTIAFSILTVFSYITAYYRMREAETIDRM